MKLYYMPGACSLAAHIAMREAGLDVELVKVERDKSLPGGGDYLAINDKGYVPAIEIEGGQLLTENPAVLQYVADRAPGSGLAPAASSPERYRLQEWLGFVGTEVHKQFSPLFKPDLPEDARERAREYIGKRLGWLDAHIAGRFLAGDAFTVADAYLFVVLRWARPQKIELATWPKVAALFAAALERPAVRAALEAEGLKLPS